MNTGVGPYERLFDLTRRVASETTEAGLLQCFVEAACEMTEGRVGLGGHDYLASEEGGRFRVSVSRMAPELHPSVATDHGGKDTSGVHLALLGSRWTLRMTEGELMAHPAWPQLADSKGPPLRGVVAARLTDADGATAGMLLVSDRRHGEFTTDDETVMAHLSTLASAYLANMHEREQAQTREDEAIARTRRLASRLHQRSERLARLEERHRLAQELHDSVSQSLYAISLSATAANKLLRADPERTSHMLDFVLIQARAAVTEMRALVYELRSQALATEGLHVAFTRLAESLAVRWELHVDLQMQCEPEINLEAKEALYRIGQEALRNTARHARVSQATLRVTCGDGVVVLEEMDDGVGFNPLTTVADHAGFDLMRLQAVRNGGVCEISSAPGAGTRVRATLPGRGSRLH